MSTPAPPTDTLKASNATLDHELTEAAKDIAALTKERMELGGKVWSLEKERDELRDELAATKARLGTARAALDVALKWGVVNPAYTHECIVEAVNALDAPAGDAGGKEAT